ncbi:MAG: signal peptidase I [Oscillospiraceae bacterium]|nr:signal peptidase I [Oscillospiraceae bacterium]MBQ6849471.1 signal peptidase I [Oscillospiraceae bacterium]
MTKKFSKIWDMITTLLVVMVAALAILLVGMRFAGYKVFTVLSGSMEPAYHTGSVIYVKEVDYTQLQAGDVITFMISEDMVATHRIVGVVPDEEDPSVLRYRTKGDANDSEDGTLVHYKNIIGSPVFTIPYLGYVASYIQSPPGSYIAIAAAAFILMLTFIPDLFAKDEEEKA